MSGPSLEELMSKVGNRYQLVMLISKRARELSEGAKPLVRIGSKNPIDIATAEIASGKIKASFSTGRPLRNSRAPSKEDLNDRGEEEKGNQEDNST